MRYGLVVLVVVAGLSVTDALAAPLPAPYAILDIGPPAWGETMEQHRESKIRGLLHPVHGTALYVREDEEVRKLNLLDPQKDARPWLTENLRVTAIPETRLLRLEFRGGNREEQVVMLNAFLRHYLRVYAEYREWREECHRKDEQYVARLPGGSKPSEVLQDRMSKDRILIAAYKQIGVVRWAK